MDLARALPELHTAELLEEAPPPEARQLRESDPSQPRLPSSKLLQNVPPHVGLSKVFIRELFLPLECWTLFSVPPPTNNQHKGLARSSDDLSICFSFANA